jgi:hypothetical protein
MVSDTSTSSAWPPGSALVSDTTALAGASVPQRTLKPRRLGLAELMSDTATERTWSPRTILVSNTTALACAGVPECTPSRVLREQRLTQRTRMIK